MIGILLLLITEAVAVPMHAHAMTTGFLLFPSPQTLVSFPPNPWPTLLIASYVLRLVAALSLAVQSRGRMLEAKLVG